MPEKVITYYQVVIKIYGCAEKKWAIFFALFGGKSAKNALLKKYMDKKIRKRFRIRNNIPGKQGCCLFQKENDCLGIRVFYSSFATEK